MTAVLTSISDQLNTVCNVKQQFLAT